MKAFIIHGTYGSPTENWIPWLKNELEQLGCQVTVPTFPTPEGQDLETWLSVWQPHNEQLDDQTILIGHSLGATFALRILEQLPQPVQPIRAAFLIAGFAQPLAIPSLKPLLASFVQPPFDWPTIRANASEFHVFQSDNDPYVPFERGGELARNLGCELTIIKNAGHFSEKTGFNHFDELLVAIKRVLEADQSTD